MKTKTQNKISRRKMLRGSGAAAVGAAALATSPQTAEAAEAKAPRWAMVMDLRRCIGWSAPSVG